MKMALQRFIIRYFTPYIWKAFPERKLAALRRFALVEKDSGCRFMQYMTYVDHVETQRDLFQHAQEEFFHSKLFEDLAKSLDNKYVSTQVPPRKFLITENSKMSDLVDAYAYAYVGENAIDQNFWAYNNKRMETSLRKVFARVAADEALHAKSTDAILLHFCNKDMNLYNKSLASAERRRFSEEYSAVMTKVGEFQLAILLKLIYLLTGVLSYFSLRARMRLNREDELSVFKEQIEDFEKMAK